MKIEIWSDIACPWCFIGKQKFDKALKQLDSGVPVEVVWRSYELNPSTPKGQTTTVTDFLSDYKGLPKSYVQSMLDQATLAASKENLHFKFEIAKHVNTFDAHRLVHYAQSVGKGNDAKQRLFSAYFERGESLADRQKLIEIATELGLDADKSKAVFESDQFAAQVLQDEAMAKQFGVTGVPHFRIDGKYNISGAQSPEKFLEVLKNATQNTGEKGQGLDGKRC